MIPNCCKPLFPSCDWSKPPPSGKVSGVATTWGSIPKCWANNAHNRSNFFLQIDSGGGKEAGLRSQEIGGRGRSRTQERAKTQDSGETLSERGRNNTVKQPSKEPFVIMDQNEEMHIKKQVPWRKLTKCRKMTMNTELLPHGCQAIQNQISENPNPWWWVCDKILLLGSSLPWELGVRPLCQSWPALSSPWNLLKPSLSHTSAQFAPCLWFI